MGKSDLRVFIGADVLNFNKNIKAALQQLSRFEGVAKSVGSSIKTALVSAFAIDSALRFFSTMIEYGRGFEDQMAKVKAVSNANTKEFLMMREEAARLGSTTRYSASEAARALENLTRNGLSARKATKALASVLELAGANAIELAEAADIVTNTMNMFGLSVEELNRVNDVLSRTTASSATNITDLYEALKYGAPTANLFGIEIEEVNAALGILANQGIKGSLAGTTLRNVLNSLVKPSRLAADILANLGIDEVSVKMDGLLGTLQKLQGLQISDFVKIFGKEFGGITKALVDKGDLTSALLGELENSAGTAARMFELGAGGFNKAVDNFKSAFEGAMIKMFESVKPILTSFVNGMTGFLLVISNGTTLLTIFGTTGAGLFVKGLSKAYTETKKANTAILDYKDLLLEINNVLSDNSKWKNIQYDDGGLPNLDDFRGINEHLTEVEIKARNLGKTIPSLKKAMNDLDSVKLKDFHDALHNASDALIEIGKEGLNVKDILTNYSEDDFYNLLNLIGSTKREIQELKKSLIEVGASKSEIDKLSKAYTKLNIVSKQFNKSTGNIANVKVYQEVLKALQVDLDNVEKKTNFVGNAFAKAGNKIKGLFNAIGGWWTVGITAVTFTITSIVKGVEDLNRATKEANKLVADAKKENDKLGYSFKTLVSELAAAEKGSIAWQTRLSILKRDYPDLVEELKLTEVFLNSTSNAYKNLASAMDEVISRQNKVNLAEASNAARDRLNKAYLENDYGWLSSNTKLKSYEEAAISAARTEGLRDDIRRAFQDIGEVLTRYIKGKPEEVNAIKVSEISKILSEVVAPKAFNYQGDFATKYGLKVAEGIYKDYMKRAGNEIAKLPSINGDTFGTTEQTLADVNKSVSKALAALNEGIANAEKDANTKFTDKEQIDSYVESETKSLANLLIDEILNKFKGIKIDGKDVRDILKANTDFTQIVNAARTKVTTSDGGDTTISDAEAEYTKTLDTIKEELKRGLITSEEADKMHLQAVESLISTYRNQGEVTSATYASYIKLRDSIEGLIKANEDEAEATKKAAEKKAELEKNQKQYKDDLAAIFNKSANIDLFADNIQEDRLEHLRGQLEDLKQLRTDVLGKEGMTSEVEQLDGYIVKLTAHVKELDKAFTADKLKEFKKEVNKMRNEVSLATYDTITNFGNSIINVGDALRTLDNLGDIEDDWERFATGLQAFISITDTLVNTVVGIKNLSLMFDDLAKSKKALDAITTGSLAANIAAIEGEAAAVVGAEATKSAAIEAASVANIAAKLAQAEAAQILMAAESTAAYAAIPFAGVGLASALIAEMKALIVAAASLPAFAGGGIVAGNKTVGDLNLARVNAGEMILNNRQLRNLFNLLNGNGTVANDTNKVEFKIRGSELIGVLNNYNNKRSKV